MAEALIQERKDEIIKRWKEIHLELFIFLSSKYRMMKILKLWFDNEYMYVQINTAMLSETL